MENQMRRFLFTLGFLLAFSSTCFAAQLKNSVPAAGDNLTSFPTDNQAQDTALLTLVANYRHGMKLTYSSASTITVGAGEIITSNSGGTVYITAWNPSTTAVTFANIDAGSEAPSTTYYIYAVSAGTSSTTVTFSVSLSATAPTGATYYRRIGSFYNDASSNITLIADDDNPSMGAASAKTAGTIYQATTDGFISGSGSQNPGGTGTLIVYSDSASTPTTVLGEIVSYNSVNDSNAFCFPIKKGDYYKVTASYWTMDAYKFTPIGN
jgi:hypothetical protein